MKTLSAADQMLVAALTLAERHGRETAAPQAQDEINAFGPFYFGRYCQDWQGAAGALAAQGLAVKSGETLALTPAGVARANQLRADHPRGIYAYNEFYSRARRSPAHARFCERVYGRDLCQHGMADMRQIDDLAAFLKAGEATEILELGCGNGAVAAYLAGATGARVTGVDFAEEAIAWAQAFTDAMPGRLKFATGDMATVDFPPGSFDAIVLIDGVYFVRDMAAFLRRLLAFLRPGGTLYFFYSVWTGDPGEREGLQPHATPLARASQEVGLAYAVDDYSAGEPIHWREKLRVAEQMKADFAAEGNAWLHHRRWIEAESHRHYVEQGLVRRYLYRLQK